MKKWQKILLVIAAVVTIFASGTVAWDNIKDTFSDEEVVEQSETANVQLEYNCIG